ncbi:hypothetical protein D6D22_10694 [Aureobasidium pullulans]|uniref:Uncharacterized protein n=1 Tax=Aureobasidium pullulans TaxID=5580 RepID=A0A4S9EKB0_AURPU|nr:hypothetical protein D6D22_10694 [Aureobasidium pullulans]THX31940.1 hypothetical protein D6D12_02586 [Aureobasidium pullulans]THX34912.1 hypothetical protein D6D11_09622 [Aureobasidium pullulans]THX91374.1 hypothetical protein D6D08_03182 [Aureobasidium pullulans]
MTAAKNRRGHTSSSVQKKHSHFSESKKDKKEKKYVTTNSVFKNHPDRIHKRDKASSKSKRDDLGKSVLGSRRKREREPSSSPPPRRYTLADESNAVFDNYKSHVSDDAEQTIARAYKDLVQQLEQTTIAPDSLSNRIAETIEAAQAISTPLADEPVSVNFKDAKGNILRNEQIPIGDTVTRFEQILQKKKDDLTTLWEEWEDVRQEIAETGADILHDQKFPSQFGLEAANNHYSPLSHTNPEVESLRRLIQKESEKAYKELDQEAKDSVAAHREYQGLWISWLQQNT